MVVFHGSCVRRDQPQFPSELVCYQGAARHLVALAQRPGIAAVDRMAVPIFALRYGRTSVRDPLLMPHVAAVRAAAVHPVRGRNGHRCAYAVALWTHVTDLRADVADALRLPHLGPPLVVCEGTTIRELFVDPQPIAFAWDFDSGCSGRL